jgi:hypothetical protein
MLKCHLSFSNIKSPLIVVLFFKYVVSLTYNLFVPRFGSPIPTLPPNVVIPDTVSDDKHIVVLFNVVVPDTFNDDKNVDDPKTNKFVKLVLFKIVVDVAFKLLIDNVELVDKLFKLLKIVVDVLFKLMRFELIVNTDKPDVVIFPTTFNVLFIVVILFNVVDPATFNDDNNVDELETTN